jgi:hypothetical protein
MYWIETISGLSGAVMAGVFYAKANGKWYDKIKQPPVILGAILVALGLYGILT